MLKVKKLDPRATIPTCAHPGEDLAYDIYALEDATLDTGLPTRIRTGIAAMFDGGSQPYGLLFRDRSSMAGKGIMVSGGVLDAGYRGELMVLLTNTVGSLSIGGDLAPHAVHVKAGDRIAQMIPMPVLTGSGVEEVETLPESKRGTGGFGSTGR